MLTAIDKIMAGVCQLFPFVKTDVNFAVINAGEPLSGSEECTLVNLWELSGPKDVACYGG